MRPLELIKRRAYPYETEEREGTYLALNENPFPFPEELVEEVFRRVETEKLKTYYDSPDRELLRAILGYLDSGFLSFENVSIGNGADEIIYVTMLMFDRVVFFPPTYSCYKVFAKALGVKYLEIPLKEGLKVPDVTLGEGDVVFLPNPNNPTGHVFEREEVVKLLEKGAFVVLDEAYYEFHGESCVDLLKRFENLAVVRTFSKAFSLAAQRIGYVVSSRDFIDAYNRVRLPFNVSYVSQVFAKVALEHLEIFEERIRFVVRERERMKERLREKGFNVTDSRANFVFITLAEEEKERALELLRKNRVVVRNFKEGIRITVGKKEENDLVLELLGGM